MRAAQLKRFESSDGIVHVEADVNHTLKTAQFVKGNFRAQFRRGADDMDDEKVREWYAWGDEDEIVPNQYEFLAHVPQETLEMQLYTKELLINRSTKSLIIEPQACMNFQECRPADQVILLPYLCDHKVVENLNIDGTSVRIPDDDFQEVLRTGGPHEELDEVNFEYQYSLDEQNIMFISNRAYVADDEPTTAQKLAESEHTIANSARMHLTGDSQRVLYHSDDDDYRPFFTLPPLPEADAAGYAAAVNTKLANDGKYGLPFHAAALVNGTILLGNRMQGEYRYFLDLTRWKVRLAMGYFGQTTTSATLEHWFEFGFPENSRLLLRFEEDGRAITENASPDDVRLPDTDEFHVFQLFDKSAVPALQDPDDVANPPNVAEPDVPVAPAVVTEPAVVQDPGQGTAAEIAAYQAYLAAHGLYQDYLTELAGFNAANAAYPGLLEAYNQYVLDQAAYDAYAILQAEYDASQNPGVAHFGNMLYPDTFVRRLDAFQTVQAAHFPIAAGDDALYIYIPIRRYSRGVVEPQPFSLVSKLLTPNRAGPGEFIRQEANLAWALRDWYWNIAHANQKAVRTFPNTGSGAEFNMARLVSKKQSQGFVDILLGVNQTPGLRDAEVTSQGYLISGRMADVLHGITLDPAVPQNTPYFFVVKYKYRVNKLAAHWHHANIVATPEIRYEMVWFKKSSIQNFVVGGVTYWGLDDSAWKTNLSFDNLHEAAARTAVLAAVNAHPIAGADLVLTEFVSLPELVGPRPFNECIMPRGTGFADANSGQKRPSANYAVAGEPQSSLLALPYSVMDSYYNWTPHNNEYYQLGEPPAGDYHFPAPMVPSVADLAANVNRSVVNAIQDAGHGEIFYMSDASDFYRVPAIPRVRNRPTTDIARQEPLLGFYGMSQFLPSSIYPVQADFPPFLQTFLYNFKRSELRDCITTEDFTHNACLLPSGPLELIMESYESFDQRDKELETVDLAWPRIEVFESVAPHDEEPTVHCESLRGKPDYIFVYLEHVFDRAAENTSKHPRINTLRLEMLGENLKCVSELDATGLYHLTRRNSHIHADVTENYYNVGAVLLTRRDCMDFPTWQGVNGFDQFPLDVSVPSKYYENRGNYDEPMPSMSLDIRLRVFFIYSGFSLQGKAHDAKFAYY